MGAEGCQPFVQRPVLGEHLVAVDDCIKCDKDRQGAAKVGEHRVEVDIRGVDALRHRLGRIQRGQLVDNVLHNEVDAVDKHGQSLQAK